MAVNDRFDRGHPGMHDVGQKIQAVIEGHIVLPESLLLKFGDADSKHAFLAHLVVSGSTSWKIAM